MHLLPLLLTVFIDTLGFGLVFPIFSPLIIGNEGGMFSPEVSLAMRGMIFGLLVSSFCIGQFFGGPILGALSDRIGRKKVLLGSMWVAFAGYIFAGFGMIFQSLAILFIARVIGGISSGSYPVAQSVIADISIPKNKTKNFGLVGMAWGTGFVIGPFLGGKLSQFGYTVPFAAAAFVCLFNAILLIALFQESLPKQLPSKISWFSGIYQIRKAFSTPSLKGIFVVMFIFCLGWGFFTEFAPVYLTRELGFNASQIGNFYAWVGFWIALCQGLVIRPILKFFTPHYLLPIALFGLGVFLPFLLFVRGTVTLFWLLPCIGFSQALIFPAATTIVSNAGSKHAQGEVLGIYNSVQWAAIALPPLISGSLVALFPHLPVSVGSFCMLTAFFVFLWMFARKKEEEEAPQQELD